MASPGGTASGDSSPGKVESPVAEKDSSATGHQNNDESTVADNEVISQLHNQITELHKEVDKLQKRIKNQDEQLQKADEMNQEMLELRPQHWLTTEELRIKREQLQHAETENQRLRQENSELENKLHTASVSNFVQPDYTSTRDRTLSKLKMGKQSTAGKAIDAFIKELKRPL